MTGSGKTLIAIMLLRHVLEQELEDRANGGTRKTAFFVVDKVALCMQQYQVIHATLPFSVTKFYGELQPLEQSQTHWDAQFDENMIIVCTAQMLLDCLSHGFINMRQINLLIFDEVHHAKKEHPYAAIMKRYYPRDNNVKPRILGLTASPVDTGTLDIETAVEKLESLMCSEIATVSDAVLEAGWTKRDQKEKVRLYKPLKDVKDCYTKLARDIDEFAQHVPQLAASVQFSAKIGSALGPWCADRFWQILLTDDLMRNMAVQLGKDEKTKFSYDRYDAASGALESLRPIIDHHRFAPASTDEGAISSKLVVLRETLCAAFEEESETKCLVFVDEQFMAMILADYFSQPGTAPQGMVADFMVCDYDFPAPVFHLTAADWISKVVCPRQLVSARANAEIERLQARQHKLPFRDVGRRRRARHSCMRPGDPVRHVHFCDSVHTVTRTGEKGLVCVHHHDGARQ